MKRAAPLSFREAAWLTAALSTTVIAFMLHFGLPAPSDLIVRPLAASERVPAARSPLPDLCAALPGAAGLPPLRPGADDRVLDRNEARCSFNGTGAQADRERLRVHVHRPWSTIIEDDQDWTTEARKKFRLMRQAASAHTPVTGLGDEAQIAIDQDDDTHRSADLLVRDGTLIIDITYRSPGKTAAQLRSTIERVAARLLTLLPPDGR